ncbi:putative N-acetylated-alpha-linked acidic dipeptidase [Styela clava]
MTISNQKAIFIAAACAVLGIGLGVLIVGIPKKLEYHDQHDTKSESDVAKLLYEGISRKSLEDNLRFLTKRPHIAGREVEENDLVKYVSDSFKKSGLEVEIHPYKVLLSYPNKTDSNYVAIMTKTGNEVFKSQPKEKILDESQNSSDVVNPFNAYSPAGDPEGHLVYVNYGRVEDFQLIRKNLSIDLKGKICIARYGKIFRADKVSHAEQAGCIGMILYSDPNEYTIADKGVYPDEWFLPGTGAQRGTVFLGDGDPETPNYPSIDSAWRISEEELMVPNIPVTPLGYDDAQMYLSRLTGSVAPKDWQGRLNITYRLGPGFTSEHAESKIKMHVNTRNERAITHNVIGYIRGTVEADRYIIIGAHRDAWVFGSIDPSSAQSILLELGKAFGTAVKNGWKPRRTIMLCSWGAEEYGLMGSTEWVEEFQKNLASRAVVYINADTAILGGYTFHAGSIPSLVDVIFNVTASLPNPEKAEVEAGRKTIYDTWKRRWPANPKDSNSKPFIRQLGSGSDYTAFLQVPGVSVVDLVYVGDIRQGLDFYPVYHSVYETFDYMKKFVDPKFTYHQALARVMAELGRRFVDDVILPMNMTYYAVMLNKHKDDLIKKYGENMKKHGIDLDVLKKAVYGFETAAIHFHKRINNMDDRNSSLEIRAVNDQLIQLERAFIDGKDIGGNSAHKHAIYAPSQHDRYSSTAFPGLVDSMFDIDADPNQSARWEKVKRQYSIVVYHIGSAASTLADFTPMKGASNKS